MQPRPGAFLRFVSALSVVALFGACPSEDERPRVVEPGIDQVPLATIEEHLRALDEIAAANGGTRAAGTPGHEASVDYVVDVLERAGYEVNEQTFEFSFFQQETSSKLRVVGGRAFEDPADIKAMLYSDSGSFTAAVTPVAFDDGSSQAGCEDDAFEGFPSGSVALLRPGPCYYRDQVVNAQEAEARAVVFSFPDVGAGEVLRPTLLSPNEIEVPVLAASDEVGEELSVAAEVRIKADTINEQRPTTNVIAESVEGAGNEIVMLGGHLDSVIDGPGINDNGSGIATILAIAEELADDVPQNRLRFAFWSGEELGLLGSTHYVSELSPAELERISIYLNFDMLGSPNAVTHIYADDGSGVAEQAHDLFEEFFESKDLPYIDIDLEGRSDHGSFLRQGVPVGGLFSGADMIVTQREAEEFDAVAGIWMDECYHKACDDIGNVDQSYLDRMAEAIGFVVRELAGF